MKSAKSTGRNWGGYRETHRCDCYQVWSERRGRYIGEHRPGCVKVKGKALTAALERFAR